jgi:hypothetical protein
MRFETRPLTSSTRLLPLVQALAGGSPGSTSSPSPLAGTGDHPLPRGRPAAQCASTRAAPLVAPPPKRTAGSDASDYQGRLPPVIRKSRSRRWVGIRKAAFTCSTSASPRCRRARSTAALPAGKARGSPPGRRRAPATRLVQFQIRLRRVDIDLLAAPINVMAGCAEYGPGGPTRAALLRMGARLSHLGGLEDVQMKCGGELERPVSNRYVIEITVRPLSGDEQDGLAQVGLIRGEYAAFARIGNTLEWAVNEGATDAAAEAAARAIRARVKCGDLIVEEDDGIVEEDES